jgi:FkbM family methyltransferase
VIFKIARAIPAPLWRRLASAQRQGAFGRRIVAIATHSLRHRDLPILSGRLVGAKLNLGGSFLRYITGDAEPEVQESLTELIKPGQVVFDVGANIGFLTILCSRLVGAAGVVYAFEPMPDNAKVLRHNLMLNGLENVIVVEKAVSSETGTAELFVSPWSAAHSLNVAGASKQNNRGPEAQKPIVVDTITLDDFLAGEGVRAPDLVKLDVEGAEVLALEGMRGTMESARPLLLCELHGTRTEYEAFTDSVGYTTTVLDAESPKFNPVNAHMIAWPPGSEAPLKQLHSPDPS